MLFINNVFSLSEYNNDILTDVREAKKWKLNIILSVNNLNIIGYNVAASLLNFSNNILLCNTQSVQYINEIYQKKYQLQPSLDNNFIFGIFYTAKESIHGNYKITFSDFLLN